MLQVLDAGGELGGGGARRPVLEQRLACLAAVLFAGARASVRDRRALTSWMEQARVS